MHPEKSGTLARFRVAEWEVDPGTCRISRADLELRLRPLLVDLLVLLASRSGELVSKSEILARVWNGKFVSDSVLTRTMTELRHVLGDDVGAPRIIETIRKRGYRLVAPVIGLRASAEPRLAVLPFENLNGDPGLDYFAAGISDALTTELGNISSLQVTSRQSVLVLTRSGNTVSEIAKRLGLDLVLEGSALHAGERVRITAQLIGTAPERHVWGKSYVCEVRDLLQVQGEVARAVADAVQATLTPTDVARLTRPRVVHPDAHLAYLKARYHSLHWDRDGLLKGFEFAQRALQIDPGFAPAHVLLAHGFTVLGYWCHLPIELAYPQARQAAARAVELDDTLGEARALLGTMRWLMDWDLNSCEADMRAAVELSPSSDLVHALYALFLAVSGGDTAAAVAHIRRVLEIDPLSMNANFFAAWLRFFSGDPRGAAEQARATLEMYPRCLHAHYVLGWAALAEGRHGDAVAAFAEAATLERNVVSVAYLATAYGRAGEGAKAAGLLDEMTAIDREGPVPEFLLALVRAGLGDPAGALAALERCLAARDSRIFWFRVPAIGGPLLGDERFVDLMQRVAAATQRRAIAQPADSAERRHG